LRRLVTAALLLLLLLAVMPALGSAHAQGTPKIAVNSLYTLNRYGFATISESVTLTNNESSAVQAPTLTFGFGNLSSKIVTANLTGSGFTSTSGGGGTYTIAGMQPIAADGKANYTLSLLLNGVVTSSGGKISVLTLSSPSISAMVDSITNTVQMPPSTSFESKSAPVGLTPDLTGSSNTYSSTKTSTTPSAVTSIGTIQPSTAQDFNPLHVYSAERTVSANSGGSPVVTDTVEFQNLGTTPLQALYVNVLAPSGADVTVETVTEPRLVNPVTVPLIGGYIDLTRFESGSLNNGVPAGGNFTITYQYPLAGSHYKISGGQVTVNVPDTPPVNAFVDRFAINLALPQGARAAQAAPVVLQSATPWQTGTTTFAYSLSAGWAIADGVPLATIVFALLLVGLFVSRTTTAQSEETEEEETSTVLASDLIKAFEEKTNLINGLWSEISSKDPNELDKQYFDELRGRLDTFRSRALQRLNEVKQKSTSQRFSEVLNQMHVTEREVDRAAKDKLNLYQQYYMRQMRKEVYDRLLPQYTKRLEKALNQLSDELHTVQREAKLL
jgi:hypothetical protein